MKRSLNKWMCLAALGLALLACRPLTDLLTPTSPSAPTPPPSPTLPPNLTVQPPQTGSEEPVFISGEIPYTSPFFLATTAEPFVMLEDQAGFVRRDREFEFALASQVIGPVTKGKGQVLYFSLPLPMVPQATYLDVDNDGEEDSGVQIFAIAYWSNTWGDPSLSAATALAGRTPTPPPAPTRKTTMRSSGARCSSGPPMTNKVSPPISGQMANCSPPMTPLPACPPATAW